MTSAICYAGAPVVVSAVLLVKYLRTIDRPERLGPASCQGAAYSSAIRDTSSAVGDSVESSNEPQYRLSSINLLFARGPLIPRTHSNEGNAPMPVNGFWTRMA